MRGEGIGGREGWMRASDGGENEGEGEGEGECECEGKCECECMSKSEEYPHPSCPPSPLQHEHHVQFRLRVVNAVSIFRPGTSAVMAAASSSLAMHTRV